MHDLLTKFSNKADKYKNNLSTSLVELWFEEILEKLNIPLCNRSKDFLEKKNTQHIKKAEIAKSSNIKTKRLIKQNH
jgi:hypothetical protein